MENAQPSFAFPANHWLGRDVDPLVQNVKGSWHLNSETLGPVFFSGAQSFERAAYCTSLISCYMDYPEQHLRRRIGSGASLAFFPLKKLFRLLSLDPAIFLNEFLLSNNIQEPLGTLSHSEIAELHGYGRPLVWRNLLQGFDEDRIDSLRKIGFLLIPNRVVYVFDATGSPLQSKRDFKRDSKLMKEKGFTCSDSVHDAQASEILALYEALYLDKHSDLNPQYTEKYVEYLLKHPHLKWHLIRDAQNQLVGVAALHMSKGRMQSIFTGYQTRRVDAFDVYRVLLHSALRSALMQGVHLNLGSGADVFKLNRGGKPTLEYTAIKVSNLKQHYCLSTYIKIVTPFFEKIYQRFSS